jgi:hypothetical protein
MKLTNAHIQTLRARLGAIGYTLRVQQEPAGSWGSMNGYYKTMMLVNKSEGVHSYKDANGTRTETAQHDPRKTLAHEYVHILQYDANLYTGVRGGTSEERYNYNEIIANSIGMLLYPTESNIIDNAGYTNRYLKLGTGDLMKHLKHDINTFYPIVKRFMESLGLI